MKPVLPFLKSLLVATVFSVLLPAITSAQLPIFYTTTSEGGSYDGGTIISFNPATHEEKVVWDFGNGSDGFYPAANLIYDSATGSFYGTTSGGGLYAGSFLYNGGTIFSFNPVDNTENVVWSFGSGTDGQNPAGYLVYNPKNRLYYGTTESGGHSNNGTIFSFNPADNSEQVVWYFGSGTDGKDARNSLVYNAGNKLFYGVTNGGGTYGKGAIISFDPSTNKDSVLWSLGNGTDGNGIYGGNLTYDPNNGLYYAMTNEGGANNKGAIISFNPANNSEALVWSFGSGHDGFNPNGTLAYDTTNGLLYGIPDAGGAHDTGAIISFNPNTNADSVVFSFRGADGISSWSSLIYNADDGLYYTLTRGGGTYNGGTIISFNTTTGKDSVLWNFGSSLYDGNTPVASFVAYIPFATGVNDITMPLASFSSFPNPTPGLFSLGGLMPGETIVLYNSVGERIKTIEAAAVQQQINIADYANGIYLVQILNKDQTLAGKLKVVKIN